MRPAADLNPVEDVTAGIDVVVVAVVDEVAAPVVLGLVAGRVDPEDPVRLRVRDDRVRCPGRTAAVTAPRVEPADRVVDDLDPLRLGVGLGRGQVDLGVEADQVELGTRCNLVDDLGHRGAVLGRGRQPTAAKVCGRHRRGQLGAKPGGVAGEATVDDPDLDAGAVIAGVGVARGIHRGGLLTRDDVRGVQVRPPNERHGGVRRKCLEIRDRDERLHEPRRAPLDDASVRGNGSLRCSDGAGPWDDDDAHAAGGDVDARRPRDLGSGNRAARPRRADDFLQRCANALDRCGALWRLELGRIAAELPALA